MNNTDNTIVYLGVLDLARELETTPHLIRRRLRSRGIARTGRTYEWSPEQFRAVLIALDTRPSEIPTSFTSTNEAGQ